MLTPTPIETCACECTAGRASTAISNTRYFRYRTFLRPPLLDGLQSGDSLLNPVKLLCLTQQNEPLGSRKVVPAEQLRDNSLLAVNVSLLRGKVQGWARPSLEAVGICAVGRAIEAW